MKNFKKLGILTLSTGLSIGILSPTVEATPLMKEQHQSLPIQIAQVENVVTKKELIKKFKEFFPKQFTFLNESDFHMSSGHRFPEDDAIRYELSFHKNVDGKQIYGHVGFVGAQLEIERFYYQPANVKDALFPAKVTKEKAKEIAQVFLKKFPESSEYQLDNVLYDYYPGQQLLTEPIRYSFSFIRTKNKIPLSDQRIQITVLGNGEVSDFYRHLTSNPSPSYDDVTKILPKSDIISKMKEHLSIDLQYNIDFDYQTGKRDVKLVYQPSNPVFGVHAISGEWQSVNGFSSTLPKQNKIEKISAQPLAPNKTKITLEEAKALAEKYLAIDSKDIKLRIESVDERKNHNGQDVISIHYMYEYRNGGTGTNLEIDKHTGDIIQYHDIKSDILKEVDQSLKTGQAISNGEALNQAVKYLKQLSPSTLHNYVMPVGEAYYSEERKVYHFSFPRVVNDIVVSGDQISVSVAGDGSLLSLNVNQSNIENWPSIEKVMSKEKAKAVFFEELDLNLNFTKEDFREQNSNNHYHLVYTPKFSVNPYSYFDANTGKWTSAVKLQEKVVSHPWAEKELNHLIQSRIIDVEDVKSFKANEKVTKGAALEVMMKSLTYLHFDYYSSQRNTSHTFENIKPDHPLYQVVERAISQGVLKKEGKTLNLNERLTREELAVWYIRILGLEQAAKNQGIYQLTFKDAKSVKPENVGFVALAQSLGLLTTSQNKFNPKQEVTYAELAVSSVRLAHQVYEKGIHMHY